MIHYNDPSRTASVYTGMPVIGHGHEPLWFTRKVAATTRLKELERERQITILTHGKDDSEGIVVRLRSALGLA